MLGCRALVFTSCFYGCYKSKVILKTKIFTCKKGDEMVFRSHFLFQDTFVYNLKVKTYTLIDLTLYNRIVFNDVQERKNNLISKVFNFQILHPEFS